MGFPRSCQIMLFISFHVLRLGTSDYDVLNHTHLVALNAIALAQRDLSFRCLNTTVDQISPCDSPLASGRESRKAYTKLIISAGSSSLFSLSLLMYPISPELETWVIPNHSPTPSHPHTLTFSQQALAMNVPTHIPALFPLHQNLIFCLKYLKWLPDFSPRSNLPQIYSPLSVRWNTRKMTIWPAVMPLFRAFL